MYVMWEKHETASELICIFACTHVMQMLAASVQHCVCQHQYMDNTLTDAHLCYNVTHAKAAFSALLSHHELMSLLGCCTYWAVWRSSSLTLLCSVALVLNSIGEMWHVDGRLASYWIAQQNQHPL